MFLFHAWLLKTPHLLQVYLKSQLNCLLLSGRDNWEVSSCVWECGSQGHRCEHLFPCGKKKGSGWNRDLGLSIYLSRYLIFVRNVNSYSPDRVTAKGDRNMGGNGLPEQEIKVIISQLESPSQWVYSCVLDTEALLHSPG